MMRQICVIGSINTDLVATLDRFPHPGETLPGTGFATHFGGKGANQAVAAARLGGVEVLLVGQVGDDEFGMRYLAHLRDNGVRTDGIGVSPDTPTGVALIEVDRAGENRIVIVPGANSRLTPDLIKERMNSLAPESIILLQLEIPPESVSAALMIARTRGHTAILDPAPAGAFVPNMAKLCDFITPNETEACTLTGIRPVSSADFLEAGKILADRGVGTSVMKAGKNGCYLASREGFTHVPGFPVKAVDTTAAGDTFNGSFAHALARGLGLPECARFANAAAAIKTTKNGAQTGMPTQEQVVEFLSNR